MGKRSRLEEELMLRRVDRFSRGIIIALAVISAILFVYAVDLFGISRGLAKLAFHEKNIIIGENKMFPQLINWRVEEDDTLVSVTDDPMLLFWCEHSDIKLTDVRSVDIDIAYRTNVSEDTLQMFYMPNDDMVEMPIHSGQNHIELKGKRKSHTSFRLDIATVKDARVKINTIVLNSSEYYGKVVAQTAAMFCVLFFIMFCFAGAFYMHKKSGRKFGYAVAVFGIWTALLFLAATNAKGIVGDAVRANLHEYVFTNDDLGDEVELIDYKIDDDGAIVSTTFDPMLVLRYEKNNIDPEEPKFITMDVSSINNGEPEGGIMYYLPDYQSTSIVTGEGRNLFYLTDYDKSIEGIRLDINENINERVKIERIAVNDNDYIVDKVKHRTMLVFVWNIVVMLFIYAMAGFSKDEKYFDRGRVAAYIFGYIQGCIAASAVGGTALQTLFTLLLLAVILALMHFKRAELFVFAIIYTILNFYVITGLGHESFDFVSENALYRGNYALNVFTVFLLAGAAEGLVGVRLGTLAVILFTGTFTFAQWVKLTYHNDAFNPADLGLITEFFGIAGDYIPLYVKLLLFVLAAAVIALIIVFRKNLAAFFKPKRQPKRLFAVLAFALFYIMMVCNVFSFTGIKTDKLTEIKSREVIERDGLAVYTMLAFTRPGDTSSPEEYSAEICEKVENAVSDRLAENDKRPNVILILAESLYEVDKTPGLTIGEDVFKNLRKYKAADVISPSFGGRTAAAEWEALTGLTNMYMQDGKIAYTSYINKRGVPTGSIAREFAENGYETYAVHANARTYYSRDIVFENMGIEKFVAEDDFDLKPEDYLGDGRVRDTAFADKITEVLDNKNGPAFIFGASLEGHSPYNKKYKSDEISVSVETDYAEEEEISELEAYVQTVKNFDEQMGRLFEYCDNSNEPYLIYIFGDHLPPLSYNNGKTWLEDPYFKYKTPLYAYSNFCDTSIDGEYISLSQAAPEIIKNAGIKHREYFDFIASLAKTHPVTHRELRDGETDEQLELYKQITWDLTCGERYLLK